MDSLICQAYFNPALITVLNKLIVGDTNNKMKKNGGINQGSNNINTLLGQNPNIRADGDFSHIKTSNLYHYAVPSSFYGQKYKSLFKHLVIKRFMIPLGIYRTEKVSFKVLDPNYRPSESSEDESSVDMDKALMLPNDLNGSDGGQAPSGPAPTRKKTAHGKNDKDGEKSDKRKAIKYVISNPDKDLRLKEKDVVFVLAQYDPKDPNVSWDDQPGKGGFFNFN